jgi:hypothetical protein
MTSSIAGFYHLRTKDLRLVKGSKQPQMAEDMTIAHELTHALQDQHFDILENYPMEDKENDDVISAIKAVMEGDATLLGLQYIFKANVDRVLGQFIDSYKSANLPGPAGQAPEFLRKSLTFPYAYGTEFVVAIWKDNDRDWDAVTNLFKDIPTSTEQILHIDKYKNRDYPQMISHDGMKEAFEGFKQIDTNNMGEYGVRLLIDVLGGADPEGVGAGWDGDRYWVFTGKRKRLMIVWFSTWDTEKDAKEFAEAYLSVLETKYAGSTRKGNVIEVGKDERAIVTVKGQDVLVLDGAPKKVTGDDLWDGFKKKELKKITGKTLK